MAIWYNVNDLLTPYFLQGSSEQVMIAIFPSKNSSYYVENLANNLLLAAIFALYRHTASLLHALPYYRPSLDISEIFEQQSQQPDLYRTSIMNQHV